MTTNIEVFGTTASGQSVQAIHLRAGDLSAVVLTWGAVLQDLRLKGVGHGLTLGSDRLADYEGCMRYHGALIGPVVNRISGAHATIAGQDRRFEANQDGRHCLHSGAAGTHLKVWTLQDASASHASLCLDLPDGEGGFPGNRRITARFTLIAPATLHLSVTTSTDAPTLINVANHSYWNLDGSQSLAGHRLRIAADHFLPTTADFTPTGEIAATAGTMHDFRTPREIAPENPAFDTNFCLSQRRQPLRDVLWLTGSEGVEMTVATTEPGLQIYDARDARRPGGPAYEGLAIEAQGWPDAPNHPDFPPITLAPGETCRQETRFSFRRT